MHILQVTLQTTAGKLLTETTQTAIRCENLLPLSLWYCHQTNPSNFLSPDLCLRGASTLELFFLVPVFIPSPTLLAATVHDVEPLVLQREGSRADAALLAKTISAEEVEIVRPSQRGE